MQARCKCSPLPVCSTTSNCKAQKRRWQVSKMTCFDTYVCQCPGSAIPDRSVRWAGVVHLTQLSYVGMWYLIHMEASGEPVFSMSSTVCWIVAPRSFSFCCA